MSNKPEYLIDALDQSLSGSISPEIEASIQDDEQFAREWGYLQVSLVAIREAGLNDQVAFIRNEFQSAQPVSKPAIVRTMYKNVLRVAACIFLIAGAVSIYKYSSVNSVEVYNKYYTPYEMSTSRGVGSADAMEKAYHDRNWKEVISQFNTLPVKNNKSYFLAGLSNLELKNSAAAAPLFEQIIENNTASGENYFQDEAEYYLALSWLGNNEPVKAVTLLKKIRADKDHLYNKVVSGMSWIDLSIAAQKAGK